MTLSSLFWWMAASWTRTATTSSTYGATRQHASTAGRAGGTRNLREYVQGVVGAAHIACAPRSGWAAGAARAAGAPRWAAGAGRARRRLEAASRAMHQSTSKAARLSAGTKHLEVARLRRKVPDASLFGVGVRELGVRVQQLVHGFIIAVLERLQQPHFFGTLGSIAGCETTRAAKARLFVAHL